MSDIRKRNDNCMERRDSYRLIDYTKHQHKEKGVDGAGTNSKSWKRKTMKRVGSSYLWYNFYFVAARQASL